MSAAQVVTNEAKDLTRPFKPPSILCKLRPSFFGQVKSLPFKAIVRPSASIILTNKPFLFDPSMFVSPGQQVGGPAGGGNSSLGAGAGPQ